MLRYTVSVTRQCIALRNQPFSIFLRLWRCGEHITGPGNLRTLRTSARLSTRAPDRLNVEYCTAKANARVRRVVRRLSATSYKPLLKKASPNGVKATSAAYSEPNERPNTARNHPAHLRPSHDWTSRALCGSHLCSVLAHCTHEPGLADERKGDVDGYQPLPVPSATNRAVSHSTNHDRFVSG